MSDSTIYSSSYRKIYLSDLDLDLFGDKFQNSTADKPCTVCGRETSKKNAALGVLVTDGGSSIVHPQDADAEYEWNMNNKYNGWMGWFAIGSECIKKVPIAYRVK